MPKTPNFKDYKSKEEKSISKSNESSEGERNVNELRNREDLLWVENSSPKVTRRSKLKAGNRRRTTLVNRNVPDELADIIGKGQWVEAPTPEQINQIQSTTPAALKYMIDLVSSLSSAKSTPPSSPSGSPNSTTDSTRSSPSPEVVEQRISDTRRLFLEPVLAEMEEHQLKFALIILLFIIILIHLAVSLLNNNNDD